MASRKDMRQRCLHAAERIADGSYKFACNALQFGYADDMGLVEEFRERFQPYPLAEVFWNDEVSRRRKKYVSNPQECRIIALLLMAEIVMTEELE